VWGQVDEVASRARSSLADQAAGALARLFQRVDFTSADDYVSPIASTVPRSAGSCPRRGDRYSNQTRLVECVTSGEQRTQVVVEEQALGVKFAPDLPELLELRKQPREPLLGHEVQLAPVRARVEGGERSIDGA
jgi:hypothetical protein